MKNLKGIHTSTSLTLIVCFSFLVLFDLSAVAQLHADFSVSSVQGCSPLTVQLRDLSTGNPTSWFWDFGNHTTSTDQNPTVVYTDSGSYTVRLFVKSAGEADYEDKQNYIIVFPGAAPQFISVVDSGCAPLKVAFTNVTDLSAMQVQSWLWDFGDGSTDSSQNPTHIFNSKGIYTVSLTAKATNGCINNYTSVGAVRAGDTTKSNFTVSPPDGCASELRYFTNTSVGDLSFSSWSFGDGGICHERDAIYHYQDTGWFSVKLVTADNGCKDSIIKKNVIHIKGPVALLNPVIDCADRFTVKFVDQSIGATTRKWSFGDGATSQLRVDTHVYASAGVYIVKLKVDDNICSDTVSYRINVSTKKPGIKIVPQKNSYCKGDSILFVFTNYDSAFARSFGWDFGDSSTDVRPRYDSATYAYLNKGRYKVVGYFHDNEHCADTVTLDSAVVIGGPGANFSFSKPTCNGMPINFEDKSVPDNNGSQLVQWIWNFDDGTSKYAANTVYRYPFSLTYNVNLQVKDSNGCSDTIFREVNVTDIPQVHVRPDTMLCAGRPAILHAWGAGTYAWSGSNGLSCTDCSDPIATPLQTSTYYVTGSNYAGCASQDSITITVQQKEQVTAYIPAATLCAGDSIQLQAKGTDSYLWTPGTSLTNATIANPIAYPQASTTYTVIGADKYACFLDSATLDVVVNPKPFVNITDSIVELLSGSNYEIRSTVSDDVRSWQWLPATGLSCSNCSLPVASIKNNISYTVKVSNGLGCTNEDAITLISLCAQQVLYMPNTFSPNRDGMNDYFFPRSNKDVFIKSLKIYNRWGQAVFEKRNFPANNFAYGWDGKVNNTEQKSDVYVYLMEVECANGSTVLKKGDVSLLR